MVRILMFIVMYLTKRTYTYDTTVKVLWGLSFNIVIIHRDKNIFHWQRNYNDIPNAHDTILYYYKLHE